MKNGPLMRPISVRSTNEINNTAAPVLTERDIAKQKDASADLRLVSWPADKDLPFFWNRQPYVYDDAKGRDTYVYVIDEGVNTQHSVSLFPVYLSPPLPSFPARPLAPCLPPASLSSPHLLTHPPTLPCPKPPSNPDLPFAGLFPLPHLPHNLRPSEQHRPHQPYRPRHMHRFKSSRHHHRSFQTQPSHPREKRA